MCSKTVARAQGELAYEWGRARRRWCGRGPVGLVGAQHPVLAALAGGRHDANAALRQLVRVPPPPPSSVANNVYCDDARSALRARRDRAERLRQVNRTAHGGPDRAAVPHRRARACKAGVRARTAPHQRRARRARRRDARRVGVRRRDARAGRRAARHGRRRRAAGMPLSRRTPASPLTRGLLRL